MHRLAPRRRFRLFALFSLSLGLTLSCVRPPPPGILRYTAPSAHVAILAETTHYSFGPETLAVNVATAAIPDQGIATPTEVLFARATLTVVGGHVPGSRIVGRIRVSSHYVPFGLPAGTSYVWQDSVPGSRVPVRLLIIPISPPPLSNASLLDSKNGGYLGTHATVFRVLKSPQGIAVCYTGCPPTDHCGSSARLRSVSDGDAASVRIHS